MRRLRLQFPLPDSTRLGSEPRAVRERYRAATVRERYARLASHLVDRLDESLNGLLQIVAVGQGRQGDVRQGAQLALEILGRVRGLVENALGLVNEFGIRAMH